MSDAIDDLARRIARDYVSEAFVRPHVYCCDDGTGNCTFTEVNGARCQLTEKDHFPAPDEEIRRKREAELRRAYDENRAHLELDHQILAAIWNLHRPDSNGVCSVCVFDNYPCGTVQLYGGKFD